MRKILNSPPDCPFTVLSLMFGCLWPVISECQSFNETHRAPAAGREIKILDRNGALVKDLISTENGTVAVSLPEYSFSDLKKDYNSPYIILERKTRLTVNLDQDKDVILTVK